MKTLKERMKDGAVAQWVEHLPSLPEALVPSIALHKPRVGYTPVTSTLRVGYRKIRSSR